MNNWFVCTAQGSVIWLMVDNYLLHYDLLSGECKTEVLEGTRGKLTKGLVYRASFHMKP